MFLSILFALSQIAAAAPENVFPGRHMFSSVWLTDPTPIKTRLEQIPWTQKCELRSSKWEEGFAITTTVGQDGKLVSPTVMIFGGYNTIEDPTLQTCLIAEAKKLEPFSIKAGFTPGHEGEGTFIYQYFLP